MKSAYDTDYSVSHMTCLFTATSRTPFYGQKIVFLTRSVASVFPSMVAIDAWSVLRESKGAGIFLR